MAAAASGFDATSHQRVRVVYLPIILYAVVAATTTSRTGEMSIDFSSSRGAEP